MLTSWEEVPGADPYAGGPFEEVEELRCTGNGYWGKGGWRNMAAMRSSCVPDSAGTAEEPVWSCKYA